VNNPLFKRPRVYQKGDSIKTSIVDIDPSAHPGAYSTKENSKFFGNDYSLTELYEDFDADLIRPPKIVACVKDLGPGLVDLVQVTSKTKKVYNSYVSIHLIASSNSPTKLQMKLWELNPNRKKFTALTDLFTLEGVKPEQLPNKNLLDHT